MSLKVTRAEVDALPRQQHLVFMSMREEWQLATRVLTELGQAGGSQRYSAAQFMHIAGALESAGFAQIRGAQALLEVRRARIAEDKKPAPAKAEVLSPQAMAQRLSDDLLQAATVASQLSQALAEVHELRAQVARLKAEAVELESLRKKAAKWDNFMSQLKEEA